MPRRIGLGEEDDRADDGTRLRVDEIGASMESYRERLDTRYRHVVVLVVVAIVAGLVCGVGGNVLLLVRTNHQANTNTRALCALRAKVQSEVRASAEFLRRHPEGAPGLATAKEIRADIASRKATVKSLSGLDC